MSIQEIKQNTTATKRAGCTNQKTQKQPIKPAKAKSIQILCANLVTILSDRHRYINNNPTVFKLMPSLQNHSLSSP